MAWSAIASFRQQGSQISRNVRLFLWMVFLSNVGVSGVFLLLYNLYLVQLGYHEDFIGLLALVQMGAVAVGALPAGSIADRFGSRKAMMAGVVLVGLSTTALCLVTQPGPLLVLNFITGLGFSMRIVPYTPFLVNNTTRAERTLVFSANSAAMSIAGTAGNLIGGQLPALFALAFGLAAADSIVAYRFSLLVGAVLGIVAVIPMAVATESTDYRDASGAVARPAPAAEGDPARMRRDITAFTLVTIVFAFSSATIAPFANVYYSRVMHLSASSISVVFAVASVLAAIATVGASALAGRMGKVAAMVLVRLSGAPLLILLAFFPNVWLAISALTLRNMTEMAGWPLDGAFLAEVVPVRRQARTVAYRSVAWNAVWALTSFGAGQVIVRAGYQPLFIAAAASVVLGAAIYHFIFSNHHALHHP